MKIKEVITTLEIIAPLSLQEAYDNAGLITGDEDAECTGMVISLDATTAVVDEARKMGCNLIVSHHPIVFSGSGHIKFKNIIQHPNAIFTGAHHHAGHLAILAVKAYEQKQFADVAYSEPFYLKEFFTPAKPPNR